MHSEDGSLTGHSNHHRDTGGQSVAELAAGKMTGQSKTTCVAGFDSAWTMPPRIISHSLGAAGAEVWGEAPEHALHSSKVSLPPLASTTDPL